MAAFAALCSLRHIVEQIQHHPSPPITLDQQQVQSLTEKEADPLEARIADAAHAAEDVIESHIVDQIHAGSTSHGIKTNSSDLYEGLQKVMEDMDSIEKEVMEIKEKKGVRDQQHRNSITTADSSRPYSTRQNTMVGFDDALLEILDKLTGGQPHRQVIPIVGMGGMGKTTLARNVYANPLIQQYFDVCAWATISQEYDMREVLREILCPGNKEEMKDMSENELGEKLHKHLSGRRYLIVMDDVWSIEAWNEVTRFFPDNNNGSKIVITTRLSNLTSQLTASYCFKMKFLDKDQSWNLLSKTVFGEGSYPFELVEIGKKIADNCRGLPLSIVVTGGLLVKSKHSREYWEYIEKNLNSLLNSEDNERCLNILYMSYKQMLVHLKPCFLYMGVFSEDSAIRATMLIRLWVAEGFLKPISGKSLEEIAEECLEELADRNLVQESRHIGKIRKCSIHDLLRDLCLREAQKERFYHVTKEHSFSDSKGINTQRRIVIPGNTLEMEIDDLQSATLAPPTEIWKMPQLRHVKSVGGLYLPDPSRHNIDKEDDDIALSNLQSLSTIEDFRCSEEVIRRIPNLKKLGIRYRKVIGTSDYFLNNLDRLHKLESFKCVYDPLLEPKGTDFLHKLSFPQSLKTLNLITNHVHWDEMMEKIGALPLLEVLKLKYGTFKGYEWETVEGQFSSLKYLKIDGLKDLEYWNSESTHFPCLQQLVLENLYYLKEIPVGIGEIPTLESIELIDCCYSAVISAKRIQEEQEELGDITLQVRVSHRNEKEKEALERLASANFQVRYKRSIFLEPGLEWLKRSFPNPHKDSFWEAICRYLHHIGRYLKIS